MAGNGPAAKRRGGRRCGVVPSSEVHAHGSKKADMAGGKENRGSPYGPLGLGAWGVLLGAGCT